jgi:hypothetical protein
MPLSLVQRDQGTALGSHPHRRKYASWDVGGKGHYKVYLSTPFVKVPSLRDALLPQDFRETLVGDNEGEPFIPSNIIMQKLSI